MPERGKGNLRTASFFLIFSLLLGKFLSFEKNVDYSGEGSFEELNSTQVFYGKKGQSYATKHGEDNASSTKYPQIPTTTPSAGNAVTSLGFLLMVGIPVVLLILLSLLVVFLLRYKKRRKSKLVPSSQGSQSALQSYELGGENIKSPIFEEDTPSVMEIEMEELDKWMNSINKNGTAECECLPTVKEEEKESNHNPSDVES